MDEELWMIPSFEIKKKIHSPQGISKMNGWTDDDVAYLQ
jgi:hypothetical protein